MYQSLATNQKGLRMQWLVAIPALLVMIILLCNVPFGEDYPPYSHFVHPRLLPLHNRWVECVRNATGPIDHREELFLKHIPSILKDCGFYLDSLQLVENTRTSDEKQSIVKGINWLSDKINKLSFDSLDRYSMGGALDERGITICRVNITVPFPQNPFEQRLLRNWMLELVNDNHYVILLSSSTITIHDQFSILLANFSDDICVDHYKIL